MFAVDGVTSRTRYMFMQHTRKELNNEYIDRMSNKSDTMESLALLRFTVNMYESGCPNRIWTFQLTP